MCFIKWSQKTRMFTTFGGWSSSIVISMHIKSTCSSSRRTVAMICCIGALAWVPSCWLHHSQLLIAFCICTAMLGHQNWSCSRYSICCWLWCLTSLWHPFSSHSMSHGDYKLHNIFQLAGWCMALIEGSLIEHQLFPLSKDGHSILSVHIISQQMLQILTSDWVSNWSWP